jgi:hypothetical protein
MPVEDKPTFEFLAALITVLSALISVLYAAGNYDIWDLLINLLVIYVCVVYRHEFARDKHAVIFARAGIAVASGLILIGIPSAFYPSIGSFMRTPLFYLFDYYFVMAVALFLVLCIVYRPRATVKN